MTQSRIDSVMEITVNTAIGLAIATAANAVVLPAVLGVRMTGSQNVLIAGIFTVISLVRSYAIRRAFNGRSPWMWVRARWQRRPAARVTYMPGRFDWRRR